MKDRPQECYAVYCICYLTLRQPVVSAFIEQKSSCRIECWSSLTKAKLEIIVARFESVATSGKERIS
jgi:hypothetical protein